MKKKKFYCFSRSSSIVIIQETTDKFSKTCKTEHFIYKAYNVRRDKQTQVDDTILNKC